MNRIQTAWSPSSFPHAAWHVMSIAMAALALAVTSIGVVDAASTISRTDLTGTTFVNPCTAEPFTITSGTFQLIVDTTADGADGLHVDIRGNAQGVVAVGLISGGSYRLAGDFWSELNVRNPGYPMTFQIVEVHDVLSSGSSPNFIVHVVRHVTIAADGSVTSAIDSVNAACLG
jgi:hypothetical protein